VVRQDVPEGGTHLPKLFDFLHQASLDIRLLIQMLLQLLILAHIRLESGSDLVNFLRRLRLESLYFFLRAGHRVFMLKLFILALELFVLIGVALNELFDVSLKVIYALLLARSQVLALSLSVPQLLIELIYLSLTLFDLVNALLFGLEKFVFQASHLCFEVEHLAGDIICGHACIGTD